jgi:hypothetical protein
MKTAREKEETMQQHIIGQKRFERVNEFIVDCSSCVRNDAGNQTSHCDSHFMRPHNLRTKRDFCKYLRLSVVVSECIH